MKTPSAAHQIIIGVILISLSFFVMFLVRKGDYHSVQICPKSIDGSTDENIQLMRQNLSSIAESFPSQDIKADIIFKEGISADDFVELVRKYQLHIADKQDAFGGSSIAILHSYADKNLDSLEGLPLTSDFFNTSTFIQAANQFSAHDIWIKERSTSTSLNEKVSVINVRANANASDFLHLWNENESAVRAIGTGCTSIFYTVNLSDPIKFGGPSILK